MEVPIKRKGTAERLRGRLGQKQKATNLKETSEKKLESWGWRLVKKREEENQRETRES